MKEMIEEFNFDSYRIYFDDYTMKSLLGGIFYLNEYSLDNIRYIISQDAQAKRVHTGNKWKNSCKKYICKGEKAINIILPAVTRNGLKSKIIKAFTNNQISDFKDDIKEEYEYISTNILEELFANFREENLKEENEIYTTMIKYLVYFLYNDPLRVSFNFENVSEDELKEYIYKYYIDYIIVLNDFKLYINNEEYISTLPESDIDEIIDDLVNDELNEFVTPNHGKNYRKSIDDIIKMNIYEVSEKYLIKLKKQKVSQ